MKKIVYTIAAIVIVGLIAYGLRPQPTMVDLGTVEVGPMRVTVDEEGKTRIKERYTVVAPLSGQMKRIELKPGDPVERGQTQLTSIEPTDPTLLDALRGGVGQGSGQFREGIQGAGDPASAKVEGES